MPSLCAGRVRVMRHWPEDQAVCLSRRGDAPDPAASLPSGRRAASPIEIGMNESPKPKTPSAAAKHIMVAAVISGPIPSPSITTMRTGADEEAIMDAAMTA